jgi:hypothetical protein
MNPDRMVQALRVIRTWAAFDMEENRGHRAALMPADVVELCDEALSKGCDTEMANAKTQKKAKKQKAKKEQPKPAPKAGKQ